MPGPLPKPAAKRRQRRVPANYGLATPTTAPAARVEDRELGFDASQLVRGMWEALQSSAESRFYSSADWERARWELWYANETMRKPTCGAWEPVQHGLRDLMISPADKRRLGVDLQPPDAAESEAVVAQLDGYKSRLKTVAPQ